ncbi:MAG: hypothetical protein HZB16_17235 [Armatimonadetes bacterium]|nr:hypothetical protein [Armatimonadota bacterium]
MWRRWSLLGTVACALAGGLIVGGCGSGETVVLGRLLGSWRNGSSQTLTIARASSQQTRVSEGLVITYPSEVAGTSYLLNGTLSQSGHRYSGAFQVASGPSVRSLGPLVVGTTVTVTLNLDGDSLNSSISRAGLTVESDWTRVAAAAR